MREKCPHSGFFFLRRDWQHSPFYHECGRRDVHVPAAKQIAPFWPLKKKKKSSSVIAEDLNFFGPSYRNARVLEREFGPKLMDSWELEGSQCASELSKGSVSGSPVTTRSCPSLCGFLQPRALGCPLWCLFMEAGRALGAESSALSWTR